MEVKFLYNGLTMAFENGQQVPEAQEAWILTYCKLLEEKGIDPTKQNYELPDGQRVKVFKTTEGGYNWEMASPSPNRAHWL